MIPLSIVALTLACALSSAYAGEISGKLLNPRGVPAPHIYDSVNITGANPAGTGTHTGATANDGIFYHPSLMAGIYSHGFSEKENYEALYFKGLSVPATGNTWNVRQFTPTSFCFGSEWFYSWHTWYAQSFRATGQNVVSVGLRTAGADGPDIAVAVLDGDNPYAPQIGPTRTLGVSSTNGQCAYWSAGEVPTVPGRIYTVRLTAASGGLFSPWHQTVRDRMRSESPDSLCWVDGALLDEPLELTVNQDDKGMINTMCCARSSDALYVGPGSYAGQTFTARGTSVLMVTWLTGSSALWAVSVHDGVDAYGNPGAQVGPTKYVYGVAWDGRAVVTWSPNEVPTVAGHTYFVKLRLNSGSEFVLYKAKNGDEYAGGRGYLNTVALGYDFSLGIYEEKYISSLDKPTVGMYSFAVGGLTSNSAVVTWTTPTSSDSTVEYGETTPYPLSSQDSTLRTSHTTVLTGLMPNTMYHVRARSKASGYNEGVTNDMVFVTLPATRNFLQDTGFESGAFGTWTKTGAGDIRITGPSFAGSGPRTGSYGLGGASNGGTVQGGAMQRVPAVPGARYRLSAWLFTHCVGGNFSSKAYQTITRIGIDPTGGTDPNAITVRWSPYTYSQDAWTQVATSAVASSNWITVFLYGGNDVGLEWSIFSFDDVILTTDAPATSTTINRAIGSYPDGSYVSLGDVKCTATAAQVGAYYVESLDRTAGIRVVTTDTMSVGDMVTLDGILLTRSNGERYLANASVLSRTTSSPLAPLGLRASSAGGSSPGPYCSGVAGTSGCYNVGTLVRCCGEVRSIGSNYIYINDGSLPGNGIRVNTGSLTSVPDIGARVAVTGILRLQGSTPAEATPLVHARSQTDCRSY